MKKETRLITAGRPPANSAYPVNPPIERASTILFDTYQDYIQGSKNVSYGRLGTSTNRALEDAVTNLEEGYGTLLAPSGYQACSAALLAFLKTGDHILMVDSVYDPVRGFCKRFLQRFGVETEYYSPTATRDEIRNKIRPNTKVIFAESPGSMTFEVQDLPMLAEICRAHDVVLIADNTWAGGFFSKPIKLGAHVSIQSGTKYIVGHADCLLGTLTSDSEEIHQKIYHSLLILGASVSADDAYLGLRGIRTLPVRMKRHETTALALAKWLNDRPEVDRVLHPAMPDSPGHDIWRRDFEGSSGLFSTVMHPIAQDKIEAFFDALSLFGMGFSWGGYESLCLHIHPQKYRTDTPWTKKGPVFRFHAGLEEFADLTNDLERAFSAMHA